MAAAAAAAAAARVAAAAALFAAVGEAGLACIGNPCAHGVCVDQLNSSSYSCYCVDGYTGLRCQTNWDDCWSSPCRNGATCVDRVAGLNCICTPGFTGSFCEAEVNECQSNPCQNQGTCHDLLNRYVCSCPPGYSGKNCEVDVSVCHASSSALPAHNPRCLNGGRCVDGPGLAYTCLCQPGWLGRRCESDEDECLATPCQHGALCINTPGSFACACQFGYTGRLCEEAVVLCETSPCQNDALCVMQDHNATCYCVPDYHGGQCQDQYNDCLPHAPRCFNGGDCIDGVDSFRCSCPEDTSGVLCQCVNTAEGRLCEELPWWYEAKPYQPIEVPESEVYHHWLNTSIPADESATIYLPSPTSTDEVYVYSTVEVSTYDLLPSETLSDIFPTPSSVTSAKQSPEYSQVVSASVPYPSSDLYDALFPSTTEWGEPSSMQPTPELPVPSPSVAPQDSSVFSIESASSTFVPSVSPTYLLEDSLITPSLEVASSILVFGIDVSTSSDAVEPSPVPSLASSLLVPVTSVPVDATASSLDLVNATFLPGDDEDGNQTLTPEAALASSPLIPTPPPDVTDDLFTASSLSTEFPGNDTSSPAEGDNVTRAETEYPGMTTFTSWENVTDAALQVNATGEPLASTSDSKDTTEYQETFGTTSTPSPPPDYQDTVGITSLTIAASTPGVDTNRTAADAEAFDESNATLPVPSDEYNETVTVPPDLETTVEAPPTGEMRNVTDEETSVGTTVAALTVVNTSVSTQPSGTDLAIYEHLTTGVTSLLGTESAAHNETRTTTDGTVFSDGTSVSDSMLYNSSLTPESLFTTGSSTINASHTTDLMALWNVSLVATPTVFTDSPATGVPSTSLPSSDSTVPALNDTFSYATDSTTVNASLIAVPTTPDKYATNDSSTTEHKVETTTETRTDASSPRPVETSVATEAETDVTTLGSEGTRSSSPGTTRLTDVFAVVTEKPQELDNVTIPDAELLSTAGVHVTEAATGTRPSWEGPLSQTPFGTGEPSPPPPLTSSPISLTTAALATTFQVPDALTPTTLGVGLNLTTEPGDVGYAASSSVQVPVWNATSQKPPEPPTVPSQPGVTQSDQPGAVPCGAHNCLNGGTCVLRDGNFSCQCPFNRRGSSCEVYFYIKKPYFVGASYLALDVGNMSLRRGVQVYVQFTSQDPNGLVAYSEGPGDAFFMLLLRNSLLQFVFSCGLQTVSFLQGNDKLTRNYQTDVSVRMWWTPYHYDTPWGPGMCSASMQVNGTAPVYSEQQSWSPWVRLDLLFLGGLPTSYSSPLVVKAGFLPRLNGCISLLEVNGREVDMWLSSVAGERVEECGAAPCPRGSCFNGGSCVPGPALWTCQCPKGYQGELCERAECKGVTGPCHSGQCIPIHRTHPVCLCPARRHGLYCELERLVERPSYSGSISGYSSYTAYRLNYDVTYTFAIRLHFTTLVLRQVGLMMYLGNTVRSSTQDFLALSLVRGHLLLTWDLGTGPRRIMTSEPLDTTLHTHSALIGRQGRKAWMLVDSQKNVSAIAPGYLSSLNTNNMLYIGGHPSWNMTHLPADMWRHEGFRGCVFDLRVAPTLEGPWMALRIAGSANVKECGEDECRHDSCSNGGTCVGLGATIRCECPIGWKGPRCEVASHICEGGGSCAPGASCLASGTAGAPPTCLCQVGKTGPHCDKAINITDMQFSGNGSFLSLRSRSLNRESHVILSFRPTQPDGLLFLALPRQVPGDFMGLALVNGTLQFTYHLGWRAPGLVVIRSEMSIRLQEWQMVRMWRRGGQGTLTFKGRTTRATFQAPHTTTLLDVHNEVFIGGAPDLSMVPPAVAPPQSRVPYRGCVRQVIINSVDHDLRVPDGEVIRGAGLADCDGTACGHQVCLNGGTCTPAGDTFVCTCLQEYTGARCQLSRACLDHSCVNGGTCVPSQANNGKKKRREVVSEKGSAAQRKADILKTVRRVLGERELIKEGEYMAKGKSQSEEDNAKEVAVIEKEDKIFREEEQARKRDAERIDSEKSPTIHHYCICPPGFYGIHCQTAIGELEVVRFSGRSFAVVPEGPFGTPAPDVDSLALNFSTTATHGLLLWRGQMDAPGEDFLGVGVSGGRVKIVWHLGGGGGIGLLTPPRSITDGRWHSLVVSRSGTLVTTFLDGNHYKTSAPGTYTQINDPYGLIFIGGFPGDISVSYGTEGHFQGAFIGCMKDVTVHRGSLPIKFSSLTEGQDLQPCS